MHQSRMTVSEESMRASLTARRIAVPATRGFEKLEFTLPVIAAPASATSDGVSLEHGRILAL
jgi:hypothetical protein